MRDAAEPHASRFLVRIAGRTCLAGFAQLVVLCFLLGLLASRAGVVVHELAGHFGVASLFGCSLAELRLFLFGGGFVDYACPPLTPAQSLAAELGGIGVQVGAGGLLALAATRLRGGVARLVLASAAALFVLHGLLYFATGVHYGVGDGRTLHVAWGASRWIAVAAVSGLLVAGSFAAAGALARLLAPWLPAGGRATRAGVLAAAIAAAAALHAAAFAAEQRVLADATYAETFRPQAEVEVEQALRRLEREQPRPAAESAERRRALEAAATPFPLRPWLGAGMAFAALAGFARGLAHGGGGAPARAPKGVLVRVALLCAAAQGIVVALDRAF